MKKTISFIFAFLLIIQIGFSQTKNSIVVASYNIRYENPHDGENSWENRKEQVKGLIQFHDFDIFGTQEAEFGQVQDIAELQRTCLAFFLCTKDSFLPEETGIVLTCLVIGYNQAG